MDQRTVQPNANLQSERASNKGLFFDLLKPGKLQWHKVWLLKAETSIVYMHQWYKAVFCFSVVEALCQLLYATMKTFCFLATSKNSILAFVQIGQWFFVAFAVDMV